MKKILSLLCFSLICCITNAQDSESSDYYWYGDTKILLERGNQEYIIYNDALLLESDKEKLVESGNVFYPEMVNLRWGITKPNAVIEDSVHVLYRVSSFKDDDGSDIYITHRFYVKLKKEEDVVYLQELSEQYHLIFEESKDLPLWYILQCGLPSSFNALELANVFYETGLFSVAEPEFMGGFSPDVDTAVKQVLNNQYEGVEKKFYNGDIIIEVGGRKYNVLGLNVR